MVIEFVDFHLYPRLLSVHHCPHTVRAPRILCIQYTMFTVSFVYIPDI